MLSLLEKLHSEKAESVDSRRSAAAVDWPAWLDQLIGNWSIVFIACDTDVVDDAESPWPEEDGDSGDELEASGDSHPVEE